MIVHNYRQFRIELLPSVDVQFKYFFSSYILSDSDFFFSENAKKIFFYFSTLYSCVIADFSRIIDQKQPKIGLKAEKYFFSKRLFSKNFKIAIC